SVNSRGGSAQNSDGPNREVVAGTAIIEYRARSGAVWTPEPPEKDVIQPSDPRGRRAALGWPCVAHVPRDPADTRIIKVASEHDTRVSLRIRQHRLQLIATCRRRQSCHRA